MMMNTNINMLLISKQYMIKASLSYIDDFLFINLYFYNILQMGLISDNKLNIKIYSYKYTLIIYSYS